MGRYQEATARELDFESGVPFTPAAAADGRRPFSLCVVCGRHRARLTIAQHRGHQPAQLCLRRHHAVMRQRKMLRVVRTQPKPPQRSGHASINLIVPRDAKLSPELRRAALNHRRRRAHVAARRALATGDCTD